MKLNIATLSIETAEQTFHGCPCCGAVSETIHGYLFDDTGATVVYFAGYTPEHQEQAADLILSVGEWGEETSPDERQTVAAQLHTTTEGVVVVFSDPQASPWFGETFLGRPLLSETFSMYDRQYYSSLLSFVAAKDPRLSRYLSYGRAKKA